MHSGIPALAGMPVFCLNIIIEFHYESICQITISDKVIITSCICFQSLQIMPAKNKCNI